MEKKVLILNYGMGNIFSVKNALEYLGSEVIVSSNSSQISDFKYIILPGVGSFGKAMEKIKYLKMDEGIKDSVKKKIIAKCSFGSFFIMIIRKMNIKIGLRAFIKEKIFIFLRELKKA